MIEANPRAASNVYEDKLLRRVFLFREKVV